MEYFRTCLELSFGAAHLEVGQQPVGTPWLCAPRRGGAYDLTLARALIAGHDRPPLFIQPASHRGCSQMPAARPGQSQGFMAPSMLPQWSQRRGAVRRRSSGIGPGSVGSDAISWPESPLTSFPGFRSVLASKPAWLLDKFAFFDPSGAGAWTDRKLQEVPIPSGFGRLDGSEEPDWCEEAF